MEDLHPLIAAMQGNTLEERPEGVAPGEGGGYGAAGMYQLVPPHIDTLPSVSAPYSSEGEASAASTSHASTIYSTTASYVSSDSSYEPSSSSSSSTLTSSTRQTHGAYGLPTSGGSGGDGMAISIASTSGGSVADDPAVHQETMDLVYAFGFTMSGRILREALENPARNTVLKRWVDREKGDKKFGRRGAEEWQRYLKWLACREADPVDKEGAFKALKAQMRADLIAGV